MGMKVRVAHPSGFDLDDQVLGEAGRLAEQKKTSLDVGMNAAEAVNGAHVVYARSWMSLEDYGNPTLAASRRSRATGWTIDEALMKKGKSALLMHAMPVRRNVEVTDEVLDGPRSLVYDQAENRLHSQKAVLVTLLR